MKTRIGIDIDGIMYNWEKTARYMLRDVLPNSPYKHEDWAHREHGYWNEIEYRVRQEHWKWLWKEGVKLGLFRYGHLYKGTIQAVRELAWVGDVILITHRPASAVIDTMDWLGYLRLPIRSVHILTNEEPKSMIKCDVYVDDRPENALDYLNNTKAKVCLWSRPWNNYWEDLYTKKFNGNPYHKPESWEGRVEFVRNWDEFINIVKGLKR